MKIEKLITMVKPLKKAELRKVVGGNTDNSANDDTDQSTETTDGIIIDDALIY